MLDAGSIINNRFRLDRLLGRGGFAQVFLCTDLVLGRLVAIKVLNPSVGDGSDFDFLGRFQAEARAVATLEHPNVLGVYDYGEIGGIVYLVMPYIDGGTLADHIAGGRSLALPDIARYLNQAAAGLDYAHRRGIVHRDIKPQNMLLRAEDNQLLIADFGIAKVVQGDSVQTQTAAIGTVAYMAPEQFQGHVSPATDTYALGCVLFQLLTGRVPFGGPATQAMYGHLNAPAPSLQERTEGRLPASFQPVIDRALAKHPEARYPSAGELATAFGALLATASGPAPSLIATSPTPTATGDSRPHWSPPSQASQPAIPPLPAATNIAPAPASPPPYVGQAAPPAARRPRWLVPGIGALALVAIIVAAALLVTLLPRSGVVATATAPALGLATPSPTATTGTSATATVTPPPTVAAPTVPVAVTPAASVSAAATRTATVTATTAATVAPTPRPAAIERGPVLTGHTDDVRAIIWLPERDQLASGGSDGTVRVWRTDGTLLNIFSGRTFAITSAALSPDRSLIAVGSDDGLIHLWRSDGAELRILRGHEKGVTGVAWSPDGKQLVSGSQDQTARIWTTEGQLVRVLRGHADIVQNVAWSSTGLIATASWDRTIRVWRADGTLATTLSGHTKEVWAVAWSPDGQTLASGSVDTTVRLWRADGTTFATLTGHTREISSLAWSPDGTTLASGSFDRTARLWTATGQPLGIITEHTDAVTAVAWGLENDQLATGSWDDTVRLWRVRRQ